MLFYNPAYKSKSSAPVIFIKDVFAAVVIELVYLKNESTNSILLNTCRSSIPSPTPMYFTGI